MEVVAIGVAFGTLVVGLVIGYWYGRFAQKQKDEPVMVLREDEPRHAIKHPHHVHPHDQKV